MSEQPPTEVFTSLRGAPAAGQGYAGMQSTMQCLVQLVSDASTGRETDRL